MTDLILFLLVLFQGWCIRVSAIGPLPDQALATALAPPRSIEERVHPRDVLVERAGRDCGTWTMFCGGAPRVDGTRGVPAEGACNNACYYINFHTPAQEYVATYQTDSNTKKSREQSGCQTSGRSGTGGGSVCNNMPFSQRFHDRFEREVDPKAQKWDCDEFPMARMLQNDFSKGTIRNALRCIPASENGSGGTQLRNFIAGFGNGLQGRTCSGGLQDGDTFKIGFNYDNADLSKLGYCKYPGNTLPLQADPFEFYMTEMKGANGLLGFPYDGGQDNRYALAYNGKDILLCRVDVGRTSGDQYSASVYDGTGTKQGSAARPLPNDQDSLIIPGRGGLQDLAVIRTGEMGKVGTKGSVVHFNYGDHSLPRFNPALDFMWTSDMQGCDANYAKKDSEVYQPGGYCKVQDIQEDEQGDYQKMSCYFPCQ